MYKVLQTNYYNLHDPTLFSVFSHKDRYLLKWNFKSKCYFQLSSFSCEVAFTCQKVNNWNVLLLCITRGKDYMYMNGLMIVVCIKVLYKWKVSLLASARGFKIM